MTQQSLNDLNHKKKKQGSLHPTLPASAGPEAYEDEINRAMPEERPVSAVLPESSPDDTRSPMGTGSPETAVRRFSQSSLDPQSTASRTFSQSSPETAARGVSQSSPDTAARGVSQSSPDSAHLGVSQSSADTASRRFSQSSLDPQSPAAASALTDPEPAPASPDSSALSGLAHASAREADHAPSRSGPAPAHAEDQAEMPASSGRTQTPAGSHRSRDEEPRSYTGGPGSSARSKLIRVMITLAVTAACFVIILYSYRRLSDPDHDSGFLSGLLENLRGSGDHDTSSENSDDEEDAGTDPADSEFVTDDAADQTDQEETDWSGEDSEDSYDDSRDPSGEDEILPEDGEDYGGDNDPEYDNGSDEDNDSDEEEISPDVDEKKAQEEEGSGDEGEYEDPGPDDQIPGTDDLQDISQDEGSENDGSTGSEEDSSAADQESGQESGGDTEEE